MPLKVPIPNNRPVVSFPAPSHSTSTLHLRTFVIMERQRIDISKVFANEGQIEGLPRNPRTMRKEKFRKLVKSIRELPEMTEARDLLVVPHGGGYVVVGGNMRLQAYRELGWKEVPCCILPEGMPTDKLREIVIQDNNPFGETDWDMIANEWDVEELKDWGVDLPESWNTSEAEEQKDAEEDDFSDEDAEKAEPRVKPGEIWQLGGHRLMCGDSTDAASVALLMDGNKADMVFTDPPYNVDYSSKNKFLNEADKGNRIQVEIKNDSYKTDEEIADKLWLPSFVNLYNHSKSDSSIYVTMPQGGTHMMMMMMIAKSGWKVKHELIWVKNNHVLGRTDYYYKHEPIMFGWKENHHFYAKGKFDKSVWEIPKPHKSDLHPTMKPIELIENALLNSSKEDDIIVDLYGGSGSTLIACEQLNRKCYMMELDPHYCDVIIARWEKLTGKEAVKVYG